MKAQIRAKTRIRGRDWAIYRRPDEKRVAGGLTRETAGDALIVTPSVYINIRYFSFVKQMYLDIF
jgi:hypothetical protein